MQLAFATFRLNRIFDLRSSATSQSPKTLAVIQTKLMKNIFVIDDTGSPGSSYESKTLKSDRKTYVSVFIDKKIRQQLSEDLISLQDKLRTEIEGFKEFHFTDIINRRKEFSKLEHSVIYQIFKQFTDVLNNYTLPFFNQTITPRTLEENGLKNNMNKSIDEIALDFLFCRFKMFINENKISNDNDILIDEGLFKKGSKIEIPILKNVVNENYMQFASSEDEILLQVADFFAFSLNRNQILMIKEKRTEFDLAILSLLNSVFYGNPSSGSRGDLVNNNFSKEDYDKFQIENLKKMGIYDHWINLNK